MVIELKKGGKFEWFDDLLLLLKFSAIICLLPHYYYNTPDFCKQIKIKLNTNTNDSNINFVVLL